MHVLVFEPDHTGHRFTYARHIVAALLELGVQVTLGTSAPAAASEEFTAQLARFLHTPGGRFSVDPSAAATAFTGARNAVIANVTGIGSLLARTRADHLLIPYGDGLAPILGLARVDALPRLARGIEAETLLMRGRYVYEPPRGLKARLRTLAILGLTAAAPFKVVHHLDPYVVEHLRARRGSLARRVRLMPDPVDHAPPVERETARRRLGIPPDGRLAGCVGLIDARKGVDHLLHAFAAARLDASDRLLLVGRHFPEVNALLNGPYAALRASGRIISIDRYVTDEDLALAVGAMDIVCTAYPRHMGSASIVIRAAAQERPVLASGFGWVGRTVERFRLGWTCDVTDHAALAAAVERAFDEAPSYRPVPASARFVEFHTPANFGACWTRRLRERLALPAAPGEKTWDWVLAGGSTLEEARRPAAPMPRPVVTLGAGERAAGSAR